MKISTWFYVILSTAYIPQRGYLKEKIKTFASLYDKDYEFQEGDLLTDHEPRATPLVSNHHDLFFTSAIGNIS